MAVSKNFHLADILSVTTGFLFPNPASEFPIDGVYHILDFMTGESLQTLALPRARQECRPLLMEQLAFTREIDVEGMRGIKDVSVWNAKLAELTARYGEFHAVYPLGADDHEVIDPLEELKRLRPDLDDQHIIVISQAPDQDSEVQS